MIKTDIINFEISLPEQFEIWEGYTSPFAIGLSVLLVQTVSTYLFNTIKKVRNGSLFVFILGIPIVLISQSRSAWLSLAAALIFLVLVKNYSRGNLNFLQSKKWIKLNCLFFVLAAILCSIYFFKKESADGRILIWKVTLKMIKDNPISGAGASQFKVVYSNYQSQYFKDHPKMIPSEGLLADQVLYAFNDVLQVTAEYGVFFLCLCTVFLVFLVIFSKRLIINFYQFPNIQKSLTCGAIASIIVILISCCFSYPLMLLPLQIFFFCAVGFLSACVDRMNDSFFKEFKSPFFIRLMSLFCFFCSLFLIRHSVTVFNAYKVAKCWKITRSDERLIRTLTKYRSIYKNEAWYIGFKSDQMISNGRYKMAINYLESAKAKTADRNLYYLLAALYRNEKQFEMAEKQLLYIYYAVPGLLKPKYLLAKLYYDTSQTVKWERLSTEILNYKPKVYSKNVESMIFEIDYLRKQ